VCDDEKLVKLRRNPQRVPGSSLIRLTPTQTRPIVKDHGGVLGHLQGYRLPRAGPVSKTRVNHHGGNSRPRIPKRREMETDASGVIERPIGWERTEVRGLSQAFVDGAGDGKNAKRADDDSCNDK